MLSRLLPMASRAEWDAAVLSSALDPVCRDLALVLGCLADPRTLAIPDRSQPSLTAWAALAGWDRSTVVRHRPHLSRAGYLSWSAPTRLQQRQLHQRSVYRLLIPVRLGAEGTGLGAAGTQAGCAPHPGLGAEGTGLGAEGTTEEDKKKKSSAPWEDPRLLQAAADALAGIGHPDVTAELCARAVRELLDGADSVRLPGRYIRSAIRKEPRRWLPVPVPGPPPPAANGTGPPPEWAAARKQLTRGKA